MTQLSPLHVHTPVLTVIEPRSLPVRSVEFYRGSVGQPVVQRADRCVYDLSARRIRRWDPRLWAAALRSPDAPSNLSAVHSLSGQELFSDSVDAGWRTKLLTESGECDCRWDAKGQWQRFEYDDSRRLLAVFDSGVVDEICTERLGYGDSTSSSGNQCGQLIRHDDSVGSLFNVQFALNGHASEQSRRCLENPVLPDWPLALNERDGWLESGVGATTGWRFGPLDDALELTDATGNVQTFALYVSGSLQRTMLQLNDSAERRILVNDIRYDAHGRIESETAGNGVVTTLNYDPADGRLVRLRADNGRLQDLHYHYDPVGNVVSIEDHAQPIHHFANQKIEPLRTFAYDTLYQLIEATGYEAATNNRGPTRFQSFATANELGNYTQRYEYDAGGNLQKLVHSGSKNHTRVFATARFSNRTLLQTGEQLPTDQQIAAGFDDNGNLRELAPGQLLSWDLRNQLNEVTPVERDAADSDREIYRYDAAGMRVRKVRITQAKAATHVDEVRYLPGLEIRSHGGTGEELHVIVAKAGRSDVRVLHWQAGRPTDITNDQIRFSLTDHLGSSTLELDQRAQLISQEVYYPFGETAWFAARSEVEAKYKAVRYSGKERDATGLYYYGLRYYAPWLMRWVNPDPAGAMFGNNQYCFVQNRPTIFADFLGLAPTTEQASTAVLAKGISNFPTKLQEKMRIVLDLSKKMLESVVAQLQESPRRTNIENALAFSFGVDRETDFDQYLRARLIKIKDFLERLNGDQENRMLLAKLPSGIRGETSDAKVPGDRTITLSKSLLDNSHPLYVAKTLIHEASHAVHHTRDFGYLDTGVKSPTDEPSSVSHYVRVLESSSVRLRSTGFLEEEMGGWDRFHYARLMEKFGVSSNDTDARAQHFKTNERARNAVMVHNADSLATFVVIAWHGERASTESSNSLGNVSSQTRSWGQRFRSLFK